VALLAPPGATRSVSGPWLVCAHAAGLAVALPLAGALVYFASYVAVAGAVAVLLALLALGALLPA
jgi:hypothetical protein